MNTPIAIDDSIREQAIQHLQQDARLAWLISQIGDVEFLTDDGGTSADDDFAFVVGQIIGQMLSIKASDTIIARLQARCGGLIDVATVLALNADELRATGIAQRKAQCILTLATAVAQGQLDFEQLRQSDDKTITAQLTAFHGIGTWTAKMYLYRLRRLDVLPYEDVIFVSAYRWLYADDTANAKTIKQHAQSWSPYSSIAATYLYTAATSGLTKRVAVPFTSDPV
ncbi:MAG: hypothetical protein Q4G13_02305 [Moraxella sp.]|nr:hypothetical protein [Moraxella sp.]